MSARQNLAVTGRESRVASQLGTRDSGLATIRSPEVAE